MHKPFRRSLYESPREDAHGGSGQRQVLLSKSDPVSSKLEAATKGFLNPGYAYDWHHHDNVDEFFFVLRGSGTIQYKDGTTFDYTPGDLIYNPANLPHRIDAKGSETNEFIFIRL